MSIQYSNVYFSSGRQRKVFFKGEKDAMEFFNTVKEANSNSGKTKIFIKDENGLALINVLSIDEITYPEPTNDRPHDEVSSFIQQEYLEKTLKTAAD